MALGVSNVSRIHFGFEFIVNPDPDPTIEWPLSVQSNQFCIVHYATCAVKDEKLCSPKSQNKR